MKWKAIARVLFPLVMLATWAAACNEAASPSGVKLLPGYRIRPEQGIDSKTGTISKADGLQIRYDIGRMAGDYTTCKTCGWTKDEVWRKQQVIGAQKAVLVFTKDKRLVVSFPDEYANFYATIETEDEMADMLLMVLTFEPNQ